MFWIAPRWRRGALRYQSSLNARSVARLARPFGNASGNVSSCGASNFSGSLRNLAGSCDPTVQACPRKPDGTHIVKPVNMPPYFTCHCETANQRRTVGCFREMNISLNVILRLGEESSMSLAGGRAHGFFAKPQNDKPGVH